MSKGFFDKAKGEKKKGSGEGKQSAPASDPSELLSKRAAFRPSKQQIHEDSNGESFLRKDTGILLCISCSSSNDAQEDC